MSCSIINSKSVWGGIGGGLLILLILFSGCILPVKSSLEKNFTRVTSETELEPFFSFLEKLNLVNYLGVSSSSDIIFSDFDSYSGYMVKNITQFLIDAEKHYNKENDIASGELELYITGKNETSTNHSYIGNLVHDWYKSTTYIGSLPYLNQGFYYANGSFHEILESELDDSEITAIFNEFIFPSWYWLVWVGIDYFWSAYIHGCRGYEFSYVLLVEPRFDIFAFFGTSSFAVC